MISQITRGLALATLPWLLAACAVNPAPHAPGELGKQFTATIPGTWMQDVSEGTYVGRMIKQFASNGMAKGVFLLKKKSGNVSMVMPEMPFTSRWRVVGDVVETYDIKTGVPDIFKPGQVIRDTIVSVTPNRITTRSPSGGIEVFERLKSSR